MVTLQAQNQKLWALHKTSSQTLWACLSPAWFLLCFCWIVILKSRQELAQSKGIILTHFPFLSKPILRNSFSSEELTAWHSSCVRKHNHKVIQNSLLVLHQQNDFEPPLIGQVWKTAIWDTETVEKESEGNIQRSRGPLGEDKKQCNSNKLKILTRADVTITLQLRESSAASPCLAVRSQPGSQSWMELDLLRPASAWPFGNFCLCSKVIQWLNSFYAASL